MHRPIKNKNEVWQERYCDCIALSKKLHYMLQIMAEDILLLMMIISCTKIFCFMKFSYINLLIELV